MSSDTYRHTDNWILDISIVKFAIELPFHRERTLSNRNDVTKAGGMKRSSISHLREACFFLSHTNCLGSIQQSLPGNFVLLCCLARLDAEF